jgi:hypothetical protein
MRKNLCIDPLQPHVYRGGEKTPILAPFSRVADCPRQRANSIVPTVRMAWPMPFDPVAALSLSLSARWSSSTAASAP